jgi:hypothetical protein
MAFAYRSSLLPLRAYVIPHSRALCTTAPRFSKDTTQWDGRHGDEHVLNRDDELDVQSAASKSGKRQRAEGSHADSAATETDSRGDNTQAKKDHPEAPGPVIGMNSGAQFFRVSVNNSIIC